MNLYLWELLIRENLVNLWSIKVKRLVIMSHGKDTRYLNGKLYFKTLLYVLFLFPPWDSR